MSSAIRYLIKDVKGHYAASASGGSRFRFGEFNPESTMMYRSEGEARIEMAEMVKRYGYAETDIKIVKFGEIT